LESINLSIGKEHKKKLKTIAKKEYSDCSKLLRKWIDENWKEEYGDDKDEK
jgi:hypothetical protein